MRPLTLILAAVLTVALAYVVVYWTNASDVREQIENGQPASGPVEIAPDDPRSAFSAARRTEGRADVGTNNFTPPAQRSELSVGSAAGTTAAGEASVGSAESTAPDPAVDSEAPNTTPEIDLLAEMKQLNYSSLEQTSARIGSDIQRQIRNGEILRRGRGIGGVLLRYSGYPTNANGQHETQDGIFEVDIKGPDLIVLTAISSEFGNELEMSIFGPRDVDRRVRRVR